MCCVQPLQKDKTAEKSELKEALKEAVQTEQRVNSKAFTDALLVSEAAVLANNTRLVDRVCAYLDYAQRAADK